MMRPKDLIIGSVVAVGVLLTLLFFEFCYDSDNSSQVTASVDDQTDDAAREKRRRLKAKQNLERMTCEVCLCDVTSATSAIDGGATSIELCTNRGDGGVTPSIGLILEVVNLCRGKDVEVHVLVRPRPGNFVYSTAEFDVITRDIVAVKSAGVDGIVIGILLENGDVDEVRMGVARSLCSGISLTFNRAFDVSLDPRGALESIIKTGCDRLLTSAQSSTAADGVVQLREVVALAAKRIQVIAASGIGVENVFDVIMKSHVNGVHAGSSLHVQVTPMVNDSKDAACTSDSEISDMSVSAAVKFKTVNETIDWRVGHDLAGLSDSYECVSAAKVLKLSETVRTAWLLLSLETGEGAVCLLSDLKALEELTGQKVIDEAREERGSISKATSADFSDDIFSEQSLPKVSIETSYVHVDVDSSTTKKWSWFWRH